MKVYTTGISERTDLVDTDLQTGQKTPHVRVVNHQVVRVDELVEWLRERAAAGSIACGHLAGLIEEMAA